MIVFSSFAPEQLRAEETSSVDIRNLRTYLDLAAHGPSVLPQDSRRRAAPDRHRDEIAEALRARELTVRTDVGLSGFKVDLTLALADQVLDEQPRERPEPVAGATRDIATGARGNGAPGIGSPEPSRHGIDQVWRAPVEVFVSWVGTSFGGVDVLDELPRRGATRVVAGALTEVVAAEGPIHQNRLAKLVGGSFGLERVSGSRREAILQALPPDLRVDGESVVWPAHRTPEDWTGFRTTPEGVERPLDHVPLREIVNAMTARSRTAAGMAIRELHREVLDVFGFRRLTSGVEERLDSAIHLGVTLGRLRVDQDGIVHAA